MGRAFPKGNVPHNRTNLVGQRFGRLLVEAFAGISDSPSNRNATWLCACDCKQKVVVRTSKLRNGHTKSCGCLQREVGAKHSFRHGMKRATGKAVPEYSAWCHAVGRCYNPSDQHYAIYGGRGIQMCERWRGDDGFTNFFADMGPKPSRLHTLDRYPNPNGNYEPSNCRWATMREQCRNKSKTVVLEFRGQKKPLITWCEELGLRYGMIIQRIRKGWSVERALTTPRGPRVKKTHLGRILTAAGPPNRNLFVRCHS